MGPTERGKKSLNYKKGTKTTPLIILMNALSITDTNIECDASYSEHYF